MRGGAIQVAGRLVGQHAGRLRDQRARQRHALPFAAGQLARHMRDPLGQPDTLQHRARRLLRLVARHAPNQQGHGNVVERGKFRQQMMELVDESERGIAQVAARLFIQAGEIAALQTDRAGGRRIQPAEQVQQGRFAGTGSADDGDPLALDDVEVESLQHLDRVFPLRKGLSQATAR